MTGYLVRCLGSVFTGTNDIWALQQKTKGEKPEEAELGQPVEDVANEILKVSHPGKHSLSQTLKKLYQTK